MQKRVVKISAIKGVVVGPRLVWSTLSRQHVINSFGPSLELERNWGTRAEVVQAPKLPSSASPPAIVANEGLLQILTSSGQLLLSEPEAVRTQRPRRNACPEGPGGLQLRVIPKVPCLGT